MDLKCAFVGIGLSVFSACASEPKPPEISLQFAAETVNVPIADTFGTERFIQPLHSPSDVTALRCYGLIRVMGSSTLSWSFRLNNETSGELILLLDNDAVAVNGNQIELDINYKPEADAGDGILDNVTGGDEVSCTLSAQDEIHPMVIETLFLSVEP